MLVLTDDVLLPRMAGPAMRAWHMAGHLSEEHDVWLLTTSPHCSVSSDRFRVASIGHKGISAAEQWADVMVIQGYGASQNPLLAQSSKVIVSDLYDPIHLETLAFTKDLDAEFRTYAVRKAVEAVNAQLKRADFIICASERQRDLYIGQLATLGRLTPLSYDHDPTLRSLIDVVPFGLPDVDPAHTRPAVRGVVPGIGHEDDLLLWAGGVYNWLDPLSLIEAVHRLSARRPTVRLYFMGLRHPNPSHPRMQMAIAAQGLAEQLGLTNRYVFFNEGWVDYDDRQNFLLEATLGVTAHFDSAETRFAFRTRALDYFWAGLPVVSTEGDALAELVRDKSLGLAVPAQDPVALENALYQLLSDTDFAASCRANVLRIREAYRWSTALEPLAAFCRDPRRAADTDNDGEIGTSFDLAGGSSIADFGMLFKHYYRVGGWREVVRRSADKALRTAHSRWHR